MLALSSIRGRRASFAGTFLAVALGSALIAMTLLVFASAQPTVPDRLSKADTIVHGVLADGGDRFYVKPWPSAQANELTQRLSSVPGVHEAIADRAFYAQPAKDGPVEGHNFASLRLGGYQLVEGRAPTGEQELAVDAALGFKPGAEVEVLLAQGPRQMLVTATVTGPGVYVSEELAAQLSPGVAAIGLVTNGSVDLSTVDLFDGAAVTGEARSVLESPDSSKTRWLGAQLLTAMALLGLFVTVFIVASTFALSAAQRRRELGLLRSVGATPRQIRRLVRGEALLVGAIAATAGAALGAAVAAPFGRLLVHWGLENPDFLVRLELWPIAAAIVAGTLTGVLGAWPASRRAARTAPMAALQEAAIEKQPMSLSRWIFGALALAGGAALAVASGTAEAEDRVTYALETAMALIVAAALLAPVVIKPLVRLVTLPVRNSRGAGGLVVRAEMLNATRRSASAAAPIIATVGFATLLTGMVQTMSSAYPAGKSAEMAGVSIAVPDGTPGLTEETVKVAGGQSVLPARVFADGKSYRAAGVPAVEGSELEVTFADGVTVKVAAQVTDGQYELFLPREVVRAHDLSALAPVVTGAAATGAGGRLTDAKEYADLEYGEDTRLLWLFTLVLVGLSVGYTGISVLNTMTMASAGRKTDLGILRKAGATVRQVLTFHAAETILVVVIGAALGLMVTVPALMGMSAGLAEEMKVAVPLKLHLPSILLVCGSCLLLAVTSSTVSAWRLVRRT